MPPRPRPRAHTDHTRTHARTHAHAHTQLQALANGIAAIAILVCGWVATDTTAGRALAVVCLCVALAATGLAYSGCQVNHLDIAPAHAAMLMGISNTVATIPGFLTPQLVSWIATADPATETEAAKGVLEAQWFWIFGITAGVYASGALVYVLGASGELQSWAGERESAVAQERGDTDDNEESGEYGATATIRLLDVLDS